MKLSSIIKSPVITEKTIKSNRYAFIVDRRAAKPQIRQAVENQFDVKVVKINTTICKGKSRRRPRSRSRITLAPRKKVFVTLAQNQTIPKLEVKS